MGLLAANQIRDGKIRNFDAFNRCSLSVWMGFGIGHSPSPNANIDFDIISNLDEGIFRKIFWNEFGSCTVRQTRKSIDDFLVIQGIFGNEDINILGGTDQAVEDHGPCADDKVFGSLFVQESTNIQKRIF